MKTVAIMHIKKKARKEDKMQMTLYAILFLMDINTGKGTEWNRLVWRFSLEDLQVPEEQEKLDNDKGSAGDEVSAGSVDFDDEPDHEDGSNQEQQGADHGVDSFLKCGRMLSGTLEVVAYKPPGSDVQEVEHEEHDVDDNADKVESRRESETSFSEARASSVPVSTISIHGLL